MNLLQAMLCKLFGHEFEDARQYFLPARQCKKCGLEQVMIPSSGWTDRSQTND